MCLQVGVLCILWVVLQPFSFFHGPTSLCFYRRTQDWLCNLQSPVKSEDMVQKLARVSIWKWQRVATSNHASEASPGRIPYILLGRIKCTDDYALKKKNHHKPKLR